MLWALHVFVRLYDNCIKLCQYVLRMSGELSVCESPCIHVPNSVVHRLADNGMTDTGIPALCEAISTHPCLSLIEYVRPATLLKQAVPLSGSDNPSDW